MIGVSVFVAALPSTATYPLPLCAVTLICESVFACALAAVFASGREVSLFVCGVLLPA